MKWHEHIPGTLHIDDDATYDTREFTAYFKKTNYFRASEQGVFTDKPLAGSQQL